MNIADQVREAIVSELERQAEAGGQVEVKVGPDDKMTIEGRVDLDELVMAVVGALSGGP